MLSQTTELRDRLEENTRYFRDGMSAAGFDIKPGPKNSNGFLQTLVAAKPGAS